MAEKAQETISNVLEG